MKIFRNKFENANFSYLIGYFLNTINIYCSSRKPFRHFNDNRCSKWMGSSRVKSKITERKEFFSDKTPYKYFGCLNIVFSLFTFPSVWGVEITMRVFTVQWTLHGAIFICIGLVARVCCMAIDEPFNNSQCVASCLFNCDWYWITVVVVYVVYLHNKSRGCNENRPP